MKSLKKESLSAMNNILRISLILGIFMFMLDSCNKTIAPVEEPEQTLFENIPTCCKLVTCDYKDPLDIKLRSDTIVIKNATAFLTDFGTISGIDVKNNYVDPKRFPGWNNGKIGIWACNTPTLLRKRRTGKIDKIELDFTLFYFIPPVGGDYSGYPIDLIRIKILPN